MPKPELRTTVTYTSGTSETLGAGWDVMRVLYRREDGEQNSFLIARDASGNIIRKTDLILERWEVVNEEDFLRECRNCYDERDRLAAENAANMEKDTEACKCGHPFSSHTGNIRETRTVRVDDALLPPKKYDIFSDKAVGESGCTECGCSRWIPRS